MCHEYLGSSNIFVVLLCIICTSFSAEAIATQQVGLQIEDLIKMAATSRDELSSIDVTYETNQALPERVGRSRISNIKRRLCVDFKNSYFYEERALTSSYDEEEKERKATETYDGQNRMLFLPEKELGSIDAPKIDPNNLKKALFGKMPLLVAGLMGPPENGGLGIDDGSMVSLLKHGTLREKTESVDGCETYVVDAKLDGKMYATVWLDVERGVMPLRAVLYGASGEITSDKQITEIREFDNGAGNKIWLPVAFNYSRKVKGKEAKVSTRIDPNTLRVNLPTERNMFRIEFPPNTTIHDAVIGVTYQIPGDNIEVPGSVNNRDLGEGEVENLLTELTDYTMDNDNPDMAALKAGEPETEANNPPSERAQSRNSYIFVACVAVMALIIAAFFCCKRVSKKTE